MNGCDARVPRDAQSAVAEPDTRATRREIRCVTRSTRPSRPSPKPFSIPHAMSMRREIFQIARCAKWGADRSHDRMDTDAGSRGRGTGVGPVSNLS